MDRFFVNVLFGFARCLLPISFVLALILSPSMWLRPREWPAWFMEMWDEPI